MVTPHASMPLGVVLQRRRLDNPWRQWDWRAVAVAPGAAPAAPPGAADNAAPNPGNAAPDAAGIDAAAAPDAADRAKTTLTAAVLELGLYRRETEGYRANLSQPVPRVYVALRDAGGETMATPVLVTACPYEAQAYDLDEDDRVDAVPMPDAVLAMVAAFIAEHHVDQPFHKRQRTPHDPRKGGPAPAAPKGRAAGPRYG